MMQSGFALLLLAHVPKLVLSTLLLLGVPCLSVLGILVLLLLALSRTARATAVFLDRATGHAGNSGRLIRLF
jgi:hypothetical protein